MAVNRGSARSRYRVRLQDHLHLTGECRKNQKTLKNRSHSEKFENESSLATTSERNCIKKPVHFAKVHPSLCREYAGCNSTFRLCFRIISDDHHVPHSPVAIGKSTDKYVNHRELVNLCFNDFIHEIGREDYRKILMERKDSFRSIFIENASDSLKIHLIDDYAFANCVGKQPRGWEIKFPFTELLYALQRRLKSLDCPSIDWNHIANAVSHEMTDQIAQNIRSRSAHLGHLRGLHADELIKIINERSTRKLSDSEAAISD